VSGELIAVGPQRLGYDDALAMQVRLRDRCIEARNARNYLLLVEHPATITIGVRGAAEDVVVAQALLEERGVAVRKTNRGGEVTYHGPGQLVAYPIVRLEGDARDLHGYLRRLESWLVRLCRSYGVAAHADSPHTGVWVGERKIASIGIAVRRWVTYHGAALNVTTDLSSFDLIVPCGLRDVTMTSLAAELGSTPAFEEVAARAARFFSEDFDLALAWAESEICPAG